MLRTRRLLVRPKRPDDAAALLQVRDEPTLLAAHIDHQDTHGFSMWAVQEHETGEVVGEAGLLVTGRDEVELGFFLRPDRRGRGYGTEAAYAVVEHAFGALQLPAVSAYVELSNVSSLRLVFKLGMRFVRGGEDGAAPWEQHRLTAERWRELR